MPKRALFAFALTLVATSCGHAAAPGAPATAAPVALLPPGVTARVDALMQRTLADQHLPGLSVAIGRRDGTIVYAKGFGFRNLEQQLPADQNSVYNIASITKQFTAATILLLAQDGRLAITNSVADYLPDLVPERSVTLRDLLGQTSGIPDYFYLPDYRGGMSADAVARLATSMPLRFPPGTAYEYSNSNYVLLGLVIEKVTGGSYADVIRSHLLEPAHMNATRVGDVPGNGTDDARGYLEGSAGFVPVEPSSNDLGFGAGEIDSTAVDLVRWASALGDGRILRSSALQEMLSARPYGRGTTVRYGFGLHERRYAGVRELYHRGRNEGYGGVEAIFPDDGLTIAMLTNSERFAPMLLVDELHDVLVPADRTRPSPARNADAASDAAVDAKATAWLHRIAAGDIDRGELTATAAAHYSDDAVRVMAQQLTGYGALQNLTLIEKDARYYGLNYTYRARFKNAIAEYRFGVDPSGKVWNLAIDRED